MHIIAQGFSQRLGTDCTELAPVCQFASLRSFIALAAQNELVIRKLDVKVAFLNAILEGHSNVKPPLGYISELPGSVWH